MGLSLSKIEGPRPQRNRANVRLRRDVLRATGSPRSGGFRGGGISAGGWGSTGSPSGWRNRRAPAAAGSESVLPEESDKPRVLADRVEERGAVEQPEDPVSLPEVLLQEVEGLWAVPQRRVEHRQVRRRGVGLRLPPFHLGDHDPRLLRASYQGVEEGVIEPILVGRAGQGRLRFPEGIGFPPSGEGEEPKHHVAADGVREVVPGL